MKEFSGLLANRCLGDAGGDTLIAYADIGILTSESAHYLSDKAIRSERSNTIYFSTSREGLKAMIGALQKLEADLQDLEGGVIIEPKLNAEAD
jgi:hypothetical protein